MLQEEHGAQGFYRPPASAKVTQGIRPQQAIEKDTRRLGGCSGKQLEVDPNMVTFVSCPRAWKPRPWRFATETCLTG